MIYETYYCPECAEPDGEHFLYCSKHPDHEYHFGRRGAWLAFVAEWAGMLYDLFSWS